MKFELIGKTKAKLTKVTPFVEKLGQKELRPAVALRIMATVPNTILDLFSPGLRAFLYEKAKGSEKVQKQLEGVEVVSDLPSLREPGVKLGALHWEDEQTGCTLTIDFGTGGPSNIVLNDGRVTKFKIQNKDGGTSLVFFTFFSTDIDRDTMGDLGLMHQHDIVIELTAPEPISAKQADIEDKAAKGKDGKVWPFPKTPEAALAGSNA